MELNSQAIILLCVSFNKGDKPLTVSQYSVFAKWLKDSGHEPSDLLRSEDILKDYKDKDRILKLLDRGSAMGFYLKEIEDAGIYILTRADKDYPQRIKHNLKEKSPSVLFCSGSKKLLENRGIAVVGSRNTTHEHLKLSQDIGEHIANYGYNVVSGAAKGVDKESMLGALNSEGTCIGVLADSLMDKALSKEYREHIANGSLFLVSPYHPKSRFNVGNAMGRNMYIYILSQASIVVTSDYNSGGTWAGAVENLKNEWCNIFVFDKDKEFIDNDMKKAKEIFEAKRALELFLNKYSEHKRLRPIEEAKRLIDDFLIGDKDALLELVKLGAKRLPEDFLSMNKIDFIFEKRDENGTTKKDNKGKYEKKQKPLPL